MPDGRFLRGQGRGTAASARVRFASSTIRAFVGGLFLTSGQYIVIDLIRPILQSFLLPFYGLKSLHGAVLHGHGKTIFLDGPGGAGKTTTALMLARAGFDVLSDDGPLFVADGGRTFVLSSMDFAHLTEGTVRLFPELEPFVVGGKDSRGKFAVNLRPLQPSGSLAPLAVTHYIRLRRVSCSQPRLFPLEESARAARLCRQQSWCSGQPPSAATADSWPTARRHSTSSAVSYETPSPVVSSSPTSTCRDSGNARQPCCR